MSETYKFYVHMDGQTYGPYSAKAIRELDLLDDILVTEESMNGQWLPASKFDFDDMVRKEAGRIMPPPLTSANPVGVINSDGTVTKPNGWQNQNQYPSTQGSTTYRDDDSTPVGWCILSFIIPIVGWILYFSWRRTKPRKASAVCTWAWIGFVLNIIVTLAGL